MPSRLTDIFIQIHSMVIGTSAIIDAEIDGAVGMNSGIFNNPFIIWGKYIKYIDLANGGNVLSEKPATGPVIFKFVIE